MTWRNVFNGHMCVRWRNSCNTNFLWMSHIRVNQAFSSIPFTWCKANERGTPRMSHQENIIVFYTENKVLEISLTHLSFPRLLLVHFSCSAIEIFTKTECMIKWIKCLCRNFWRKTQRHAARAALGFQQTWKRVFVWQTIKKTLLAYHFCWAFAAWKHSRFPFHSFMDICKDHAFCWKRIQDLHRENKIKLSHHCFYIVLDNPLFFVTLTYQFHRTQTNNRLIENENCTDLLAYHSFQQNERSCYHHREELSLQNEKK